MPRAQVIARPKLRSWPRALLLLGALASTGLGCVNITPPWQKADWQSQDAGTSAAREDTGGEPGPVENDGAPVIDTQPDRWPDNRVADAPTDTRGDDGGARGDGGSDSSPDLANRDSQDASGKQDRVAIPDSLLIDTQVADLPVDTAPSLDAGLDASSEVQPLRGPVVHYPCENAKGTVLADTSGNGWDATLANGSGTTPPTGFTFAAGKVGKGLSFSAQDRAYLSLPTGIVSKLSEVTIATWVKLNSSAAYQRIFDFGIDTNTFMYLSNAGSSGNVRFRLSSANPVANQAIEGTAGLPVGTWVHVAVTVGDDGVSIFVDGTRVAQQAPAALRPSELGETNHNNIGRSQFFDDPYLDGMIDEFRIYDRALSPTEIADLASGH